MTHIFELQKFVTMKNTDVNISRNFTNYNDSGTENTFL